MTDPIPQKGQRVGPSPLYYELLAQHAALLSKYEERGALAQSVVDEHYRECACGEEGCGCLYPQCHLVAALAAALKKEGG